RNPMLDEIEKVTAAREKAEGAVYRCPKCRGLALSMIVNRWACYTCGHGWDEPSPPADERGPFYRAAFNLDWPRLVARLRALEAVEKAIAKIDRESPPSDWE